MSYFVLIIRSFTLVDKMCNANLLKAESYSRNGPCIFGHPTSTKIMTARAILQFTSSF